MVSVWYAESRETDHQMLVRQRLALKRWVGKILILDTLEELNRPLFQCFQILSTQNNQLHGVCRVITVVEFHKFITNVNASLLWELL